MTTIASAMTKPFMVTGVQVAYLALTPLRLPADEADQQGDDEATGEVIGDDVAEKVFSLVDGLEETGDVVKVWTNVTGV